MNHGLVLSMRSFFVVGMGLFDRFDLGCMLKVLKLASMVEMDLDDNGKLVAFGLSIWHYNFALDGLVISKWHGNFA